MSDQSEHSAPPPPVDIQKKMDAALEEARQRVKHLAMQARQSEHIPPEFLELRFKTAAAHEYY